MYFIRVSSVFHLWLLISSAALAQDPSRYFRITIVDQDTGRGVPLVELRTVNNISLYTDSAGVVAFHEPGLMGKDVFFHVWSHGYEFPKDGFGISGKSLKVKAGGEATLKIKRINIAERLYRITGAGIYRDSILLGDKVPLRDPVLNGLVLGSDSVLNAAYRGKIYWFWGDTNRPSYPLGNFQVPGATSLLPHPGKGGLDPDTGVNLDYFVDGKGFAKETMRMPGKGPTWMTTLIPLADEQDQVRLYASYIKIEPPMKIYARGLAVFDDDKKEFKHLVNVDMKSPVFPSGHAFPHRDKEVEYIYFSHPFPVVRVRANAKGFLDINSYETFTCLKEGSQADDSQLDRDGKGLNYQWRKNAPALSSQQEAKLIRAGKIKADEARWQLTDADGKTVTPHAGSVYWNWHRKRWVMIVTQQFGTSLLGEIWYAEANAPTGPYRNAVKVVTHHKYSFYNPKQHPLFAKDGGRYIYFEGTYTHTFSGNPQQTPRYDYNQIMYRLDLDDPRLKLPPANR